jgi:Transposase and inactivated derivatives
MKINRSSKCSLKFSTQAKLNKLEGVLREYGRVVNQFIGLFWEDCPKESELFKPVLDKAYTWFTARLRKVAAREAIHMIRAARGREDKAKKPVHRGERMHLSSTIASLQPSRYTKEFDAWVHLASIGNNLILDLPIRFHKHIRKLFEKGKRLESYIITRRDVQLCFEIETGPKQLPDACIGVDTGINALASLSTGEQLGTDIKECIERIKRCKQGSRGSQRAARALRQRIDEVAKGVVKCGTLIVMEKLNGITYGTKAKRRLAKTMRRAIGRWNVQYWLGRLQLQCEWNRVSFRTVSARYTSRTCPSCGLIDRRNRDGEKFLCRECGYTGNADIIAAGNILFRFLTGPYGAGCQPAYGTKCH